MNEQIYVYSFVPWTDADFTLSPAMKKLIRAIKYRHEEEMTATQFGEFRIGLEVDGISLHEISRRPFSEEETVL